MGTMFSTPIFDHNTLDAALAVTIPKGFLVTLSSATNRENGPSELCITTPTSHEVPVCIVAPGTTITGLGLEFVGPQRIEMSLKNSFGFFVTGSVSPATYEYREIAHPNAGTTKGEAAIPVDTNKAVVSDESNGDAADNAKTVTTKKRKLSNTGSTEAHVATGNDSHGQEDEQESPPPNNDNHEDDTTIKRLSKRQRKKLAKQKAKELAEAVAFLNKHESKVNQSSGTNSKTKPNNNKSSSLTRERRLPSGVLVKDIIVGTGTAVKLGRKVSILYEGSFPDGKVFDRNKNRNSPLVFRQGTGQVIKGLEKGIEGMKLGGERELTIPPELGYGKKGSGNVVPPNSTLVFTVQLVGLGG